MGKLLLFLSLASIILLAAGTAFMPGNELFLMASGSHSIEYLREILASILFMQLITHPPRHMIFRILAGGTALFVASWAVFATLNGNMLILDTLSMLAASVAIAVTALEFNTAKQPKQQRYSSNPLIA